jgi:hypothetical protein
VWTPGRQLDKLGRTLSLVSLTPPSFTLQAVLTSQTKGRKSARHCLSFAKPSVLCLTNRLVKTPSIPVLAMCWRLLVDGDSVKSLLPPFVSFDD